MSLQITKIGKQYEIKRIIGSGSFGEIYVVVNLKTKLEYAIKLEPLNCKYPQLQFESKLYRYLHYDRSISERSIPKIHASGIEKNYNYMIIDLLDQLFLQQNKKFSLKTVLQLGAQMISRLEFLHSMHFIHRDLKPDNFMFGRNNKSNILYIIDFGLAKKYMQLNNTHIQYQENKTLVGTVRYASINNHLGRQLSRRDDLESLFYILIYFLQGSLPWMNQLGNNQREKYENILNTLCNNLPQEFMQQMNNIDRLLKYSRNLEFEEKPDYKYMKRLIGQMAQRQGIILDNIYDWNDEQQKANEKYYLPKLTCQTEFNNDKTFYKNDSQCLRQYLK